MQPLQESIEEDFLADDNWEDFLADFLGSPVPPGPGSQGSNVVMDSTPTPAAPPVLLHVPPDQLQQLALPTPSSPWASTDLGPQLEGVLAECPEEVLQSSIYTDLGKLMSVYAGPQPTLHSSKKAIARVTNVDVQRVGGLLNLYASALHELEKSTRVVFEHRLASSGARLIAYFEFARYDETPMRISHLQSTAVSTGHKPDEAVAEDSHGQETQSSHPKAVATTKATTTSKLLGSEQRYGMVCVPAASDEEPSPKPICFLGTMPGLVQLLGRATADDCNAALTRITSTSEAAERFAIKVRVATTDKGSANFLTEQKILSQRSPEWSTVQQPCVVHIIATMHSKSFLELQPTISGMINLALVLGFGENMSNFRRSLAAVVSSKLQVVQGTPPLDATAHRQWVLELYCSTGSKAALKSFCLMPSQTVTGDAPTSCSTMFQLV